MQTVKSSISISSIFPELRDDAIFERMSLPRGAVIAYNPEYCEIEEFHEDRGSDAAAELGTRSKKILLWARVVTEMFGDEEVTILLFSPILDKLVAEYVRMTFFHVSSETHAQTNLALLQYNSRVYEHAKLEIEDTAGKPPRHRESGTKQGTVAAESRPGSVTMAPVEFDISDRMSVQSSVASLHSSAKSTVNRAQLDLFTQELQLAATSKETPTLIKRLTFVLFAFLAVVITLIGVESAQFYKEAVDLKERFQMIEYFQIRYELIVYLSISPRSYDTYRKGTVPSTLVNYCQRTRIRADRAAEYNLKTRYSFEKFGLEYDYEDVAITYGSEKYIASFYYALIKVALFEFFVCVKYSGGKVTLLGSI